MNLSNPAELIEAIQPESVSIMTPDGIACASASLVAPLDYYPYEHWFVNRVLVREGHRGKGLGTQVFETLLEGIRSLTQEAPIIVTPGGYGNDPEKLVVWYQRFGFQRIHPQMTTLLRTT